MKLSERYPTIGTIATSIPIFPLSSALLLPRTTLPLNIFEPRYVSMINDAISSSRLVGMVQPARETAQKDSPAGSAAALRTVGCVGRIVALQEQDDGRIILSLAGIARFRITAEQPSSKPYRLCTVDYKGYADDLVADLGADTVDRDALLATLKRFLEVRDLKADWSSIGRSANEQLVNSLAVMSPYGAEEKQALLEAPDLKTRAEILIALAEMDIASAGRDGGSGTTLQ
jgi:uncharacterized protein